jgi:hypothetical protein
VFSRSQQLHLKSRMDAVRGLAAPCQIAPEPLNGVTLGIPTDLYLDPI